MARPASDRPGNVADAGSIRTARAAILAKDPALIAVVSEALRAAGESAPVVLRNHEEFLEAVLTASAGFGHLFIQAGLGRMDAALIDALAEASPAARITSLLPDEDAGLLRDRIGTALEDGCRACPSQAGEVAGMSGKLQEGGLLLRYQPIVRVRDRRLVMVEALARLRSDPVALGPGSFVPAMERAGLARCLAGAVLRLAAQDMTRHASGLRLAVSINLPVQELVRRDVLTWLAAQTRPSRLPRKRLAIELTETSPVRDHSRLARSLRLLRAHGHEVLIDDFEMDDRRRRLLRLPFSGVKLDKDFVQQLATSARARQQVRALARSGLGITAEGVSSAGIWRSLRHLGVERAQGFWLARPLPLAALPVWASRWRASQKG